MEGRKEQERPPGRSGRRRVTYCLIPSELAEELHESLRHHFEAQPDVEVLVERRRRDRRSLDDLRHGDEGPPEAGGERRRIRGQGGRRAGERRARLTPAEPPALPASAERHAGKLTFVERLEPSGQHAEDLDTAKLVGRFQSGDSEAFGALYSRYFDRVYGYLRILLRSPAEAEDGTQQVFTSALEALRGYERRRQPFRAWLFTLVRNHALSELRRQKRIRLEDHEQIERRREHAAPLDPKLPSLGWVSDRDLLHLIEDLPVTQRQVLTLRYTLDLTDREVAEALGLSPSSVKVLHYRAMRALRQRLDAPASRPRSGRGGRPRAA